MIYTRASQLVNQPIPFPIDRNGHNGLVSIHVLYLGARLSGHSCIRYLMSNMASASKTCFASKVEYRAVIRYLHLKGKTGKEIYRELADVYRTSIPSYAQVKFYDSPNGSLFTCRLNSDPYTTNALNARDFYPVLGEITWVR